MNWVGGSRNRLVMRNDAKKQKEFFEKRKMQQRLKKLGATLPSSSPGDISSGSMDLMTLFIVNQIATKKKTEEVPKVAVLGRAKGSRRNEPLVLPMSPSSPSQLSLVESPSQCSVQDRRRKNVIPQKFKCRQLSPVLESAFSDNSACDLPLPPITDPSSPTSSASSGKGIFPLHMNPGQSQLQPLPYYSPPPWEASVLQQTQPFSQPRGMTESCWAGTSNSPLFQLETPTAAQVLFGGPKLENTEASRSDECADAFFQPKDTEPIQDFPLNQLETKNLLAGGVFRRFGNKEYETEAFNFGNPKSKISLTDETSVSSSAPQTVPNTQAAGVEPSNCTEMNFTCLDQNTGLLTGCEYSSSCSGKAGYFSSDSSDDESCCDSCLQGFAFYVDEARCEDNLNSDSQRDPNLSESRPLTPPVSSNTNLEDDQNIVVNRTSPDKISGSQTKQVTPQLLDQTQNSEMCECKKTSTKTHDAGTQTESSCISVTCDASTQCSFVANNKTSATGFSLCRPTVDVSENLASEKQTETLRDSKNSTGEGRWGSWNKFTTTNSSKVFLQRPTNPLQGALRHTANENREDGDERGCDEDSPRIKEVSDEGREEATSASRVHRLSQEAEALQEIADILLLLKQRKKEE